MRPEHTAGQDFLESVRAGLCKTGQKQLHCKYFYDDVGSALFEVISLLPEYGLTRAGERLLRRYSEDVVRRLPPSVMVVELGSGSCKRTGWIVSALSRRQQRTRYFPIEISPTALAQCQQALRDLGVDVLGFQSEYLEGLSEAVRRRAPHEHVLVLFLGSTIGNFERADGIDFLREVRARLQTGDSLLLATDLVKPESQLIAAYDDPLGVTAAFNLNLLARLNHELGSDFALSRFKHEARYNAPERRIEMHLRSTVEQMVHIADFTVWFREGETIWTESSHKYTMEEVVAMGRHSGFRCDIQWLDNDWPFAQSLLIAE